MHRRWSLHLGCRSPAADWPTAGFFIVGGALGSLSGTGLARQLADRGRILTLIFASIVIGAGLYVALKGFSAGLVRS